MQLKIGNFYRIVFDVKGTILTFTCKIIDEDDMFIKFLDKKKKIISYNKSTIISFEEMDGN